MSPSDVATLATVAKEVGGWIFAALVVTAVLVTLMRAVLAGDLIAGPVHRRVLDQNDRLTDAVARLTTSVDQLTTKVEDLRDAQRPRR